LLIHSLVADLSVFPAQPNAKAMTEGAAVVWHWLMYNQVIFRDIEEEEDAEGEEQGEEDDGEL
jgi:hypothetical protein